MIRLSAFIPFIAFNHFHLVTCFPSWILLSLAFLHIVLRILTWKMIQWEKIKLFSFTWIRLQYALQGLIRLSRSKGSNKLLEVGIFTGLPQLFRWRSNIKIYPNNEKSWTYKYQSISLIIDPLNHFPPLFVFDLKRS